MSLSSRGHLRSPVIFDDLNFSERPYDPWLAYGQSKTANILLAVEAHRRWSRDGITANAVHPGAIFETNLSRHMSPDVLSGSGPRSASARSSPARSASRPVNRAPRRRCSSPPHTSSTASAAATSRTATRRGPRPRHPETTSSGSPPTRSTQRTRTGSGSYRAHYAVSSDKHEFAEQADPTASS